MDIDEFTSHIFQPEKQNEFNVILTDFINNFNRELAMTDGFDNLKSLITIFKNKLEENFGEWHLVLLHKSLENDKFVNCKKFSGEKINFSDAIKNKISRSYSMKNSDRVFTHTDQDIMQITSNFEEFIKDLGIRDIDVTPSTMMEALQADAGFNRNRRNGASLR